jgi:asparagine synthase (glutamine-hydrolysing)
MCGVNGILRTRADAPPVSRDELRRTRDHMQARGPDGLGEWFSSDGDVALGHRRLAIIDLSDGGAQPMATADGRYRIVFNGEIYNYRELRAELAHTHAFRTRSDTEVILALFARDGVDGLARLRGMYALGIWDAVDRRLLLARDPNGVKPLYYSADGGHFRFASQVKALVAGGEVARAVDPAGLCGFLLWGSVPEPWTIYTSVRAVPAGHFLRVGVDGVGEPQPLPSIARAPADFATTVEESVVAHLVADVPVAVFLSAGLDSSLVTALATRHLPEPPTTMTLRFREFAGTEADEGPLAAETARALRTRHVERCVSKEEFLEAVPEALAAMDQPSIDGFNTFWISRAAHEAGIKVALSGLGGDELLGGYPSFRQVPRLARWARAAGGVPGLASGWARVAQLSDRSPKLPGLVRYGRSLAGAYFLRRALYLPEELPDLIDRDAIEAGLRTYDPVRESAAALDRASASSDWGAVHALETGMYLRNQLLRDSDWASMASSLELRVPFVDAVLQSALQRPIGEAPPAVGKVEVARRLAPELPQVLFTRRKTGFLTPFAEWLDGAPRQPIGRGSRGLALRVLSEWGVETAPTARRRSTGRLADRSSRDSLVILPGMYAQKGGIQTYGQNLVEALRQLDARPQVLVLNDSPADLTLLQEAGVAARGFSRHRSAFALAAIREARQRRFADVWLGHRNFTRLAPLLHRPGARVTLLLYGIDAWPPISWSERQALRSVDRVLSISPYTAECFRRAGYAGAIDLLPCSLPFGWRTPERRPPAFRAPFRILSVSRLAEPERYKGLDDTIAAVSQLRETGLAIEYHIAGDGPDEPRLRRLAAELGVTDTVRFHGRVSDHDLRRLYADCDLFVLPSGAEGFGIVYLEALLYERAVIAADAGGVPFFVRHGSTGWLVPHGDRAALAACLRERLQDPTGTGETARLGQAMVEREFSFPAFLAHVRRILPGTYRGTSRVTA